MSPAIAAVTDLERWITIAPKLTLTGMGRPACALAHDETFHDISLKQRRTT
jgi:hypothetical protein